MGRPEWNAVPCFPDLLRTFQEPGVRQFLESLDRDGNRRGKGPIRSSPTGVSGQDAGVGNESGREQE
jgi:hypothetical protein